MLGSNRQEARKLPESFKPPPVDQLASVDDADCEYGSELTEIVGLVLFGGQGGWPATDDYEVHHLDFAAWRRVGEPIVQQELTVLRPVPADGDWFAEYPEGTIHKVRVLLSIDETRAVFAEAIQKNVEDAELHSIAAELRKPVTMDTENFGVLTLNRRINWCEGNAIWNGESVAITFEVNDGLDIASQLETAEQLFADAKGWAKRIADFSVQEKLDLANDWREEGVKAITASEFLRRMKLDSISIKPDREFEFWHDDGDMFYGHSIQVSGSLKDGLTDSDIPG